MYQTRSTVIWNFVIVTGCFVTREIGNFSNFRLRLISYPHYCYWAIPYSINIHVVLQLTIFYGYLFELFMSLIYPYPNFNTNLFACPWYYQSIFRSNTLIYSLNVCSLTACILIYDL